MDHFDHILNWKLRAGSHRFPGKDGGTCINEAAIVAAGFPYRPICHVRQMRHCFSRPICSLAMTLNDQATDAERQRLLPFVTRLACADSAEIERKRAKYIAERTRTQVSFERGLEVLEGVLTIGRQADPPGVEEVQSRMASVKQNGPGPQKLIPSKVKGWFSALAPQD
jgi:hypothetical protein